MSHNHDLTSYSNIIDFYLKKGKWGMERYQEVRKLSVAGRGGIQP
jgi:hypothetical protein